MIRTVLIILILVFGICKGHAQTDPVLSGMIVLYTDKQRSSSSHRRK